MIHYNITFKWNKCSPFTWSKTKYKKNVS